MESRVAQPQTATNLAVPLEATPVSPYVFEPFGGSLIYMPDSMAPVSQDEFVVPQSAPLAQPEPRFEIPGTRSIARAVANSQPTTIAPPDPPPIDQTSEAPDRGQRDLYHSGSIWFLDPIAPSKGVEIAAQNDKLATAGATADPHPLDQPLSQSKTSIAQTDGLLERQKTSKGRPALQDQTRVPKSVASPKIVEPKFRAPEFATGQKPPARRELKEPLKEKKLSLLERLERWLEGPGRDGKRRGVRRSEPGLMVFYWSGGSPEPHEVANISESGFYVRTKDHWFPDTLVRMILQRKGDPRHSIRILARVVRVDKGGVGHEIVTTEALIDLRARDVIPDQGTDQRALERFLQLH
jgi:hypothetical protein